MEDKTALPISISLQRWHSAAAMCTYLRGPLGCDCKERLTYREILRGSVSTHVPSGGVHWCLTPEMLTGGFGDNHSKTGVKLELGLPIEFLWSNFQLRLTHQAMPRVDQKCRLIRHHLVPWIIQNSFSLRKCCR